MFVFPFPVRVFCGVLLSVASLLSVPNLRIESDMSMVIQRDEWPNHSASVLDHWQEPTTVLLVSMQPPDPRALLNSITELVYEFQFVRGITQIVSVFSVLSRDAAADLESAAEGSGSAELALRAVLDGSPFAHSFLSSDLKFATILLSGERAALEAASERFRSCDQSSPVCVRAIGSIAIEQEIEAMLGFENQLLPPLTGLVVLCLLAWWYQSVTLALRLLIPPALGVFWFIGALSILDVPLDSFNTLVPSVVLTLGLADMLHLQRSAQRQARMAKRNSERALRDVLPAIVFTTLTTGLAFASLALDGSAPLARLAVSGVLGVGLLLLSLVLVGPQCVLVASHSKTTGPLARQLLARTLRFVRRVSQNAQRVKTGTIVVIALGLIAALTTPADFTFDENLPQGPVKSGMTDAASRDLSLAPIFVVAEDVEVAEGQKILERLYGDEVIANASFSATNQLFDHLQNHGVLIAPFSVPMGMGAIEVNAFASQIKERLSTEKAISVTGYPAQVAQSVTTTIHRLQIVLLISVLLQSCFFAALTRSVRVGLATFLVSALPLLALHGALSLGFGYVNVAAAVAMIIASGIIVDDTTHLIWASRDNANRHISIRRGLRASFEPISLTTLVLVLGFAILFSSGLPGLQQMGLLMCLSLLFAWIADTVILPVFLLKPAREEQ